MEWIRKEEIAACANSIRKDDLSACLKNETCRFFPESRKDDACTGILVEPIVPRPMLVIVGGGHVGQALSMQAGLVGFEILVIDDRPEFTDQALFPPGTTTRCGDIAEEVSNVSITADTFIVVVTRGHKKDTEALGACIHSNAAYIGMIGSKRKVALMRQAFLASGIATEEEFDSVYAPIGLDIGAETVPEIAASIVAELIAVHRNKIAAPQSGRRAR
jgi:xanthine dehydrogenase accessory factor